MKPSLYQWPTGIVLALGAHALAFAALNSDDTAKIERAAGPVISIAGSLSDYAFEVETIVQDNGVTVEANDKAQNIESEITADDPQEYNSSPAIAPDQNPKPEKAKQKKERVEKPKQKTREKAKVRAERNGIAGRRGGGGGTRQSRYAGNAALSNYKGRVRARIASRAGSARGRGIVVVQFTVTASGSVASLRIIRSANSSLNDAALRAVKGGFPPIPPNLPRKLTFAVPIKF